MPSLARRASNTRTSYRKTIGPSPEQNSKLWMKQETFLNPAASSTAEAAPASANGTCGKYRKISKENTRSRWILTWGLLRKKSKRYGSEQFNCSYFPAEKLQNSRFS